MEDLTLLFCLFFHSYPYLTFAAVYCVRSTRSREFGFCADMWGPRQILIHVNGNLWADCRIRVFEYELRNSFNRRFTTNSAHYWCVLFSTNKGDFIQGTMPSKSITSCANRNLRTAPRFACVTLACTVPGLCHPMYSFLANDLTRWGVCCSSLPWWVCSWCGFQHQSYGWTQSGMLLTHVTPLSP